MIYSPYEISQISTKDIINMAIIQNNNLYIAATKEGFLQYSIQQNILEPEKITQHIIPNGSAQTVRKLKNDFIMVSWGEPGLCVYGKEQGNQVQCIELSFSVQDSIQFRDSYIVLVGKGGIGLLQITNNLSQQINLQILKQWSYPLDSYLKIVTDPDNKYLFAASDAKGVTIFNGDEIIAQSNSILILNKEYFESARDLTLTQDKQNLYVVDVFKGVYVSDISLLYTQPSIIASDITNTLVAEFNSQPNSVTLSQDNNYLFIGIRSYGINIYDIQDRTNIKLIEKLESSGMALSVSFSQTQHQLLFGNGQTLKIYEKLVPNFNTDFPNIFNTLQSKIFSLDRTVNIAGTPTLVQLSSPWNIRIDQNNEYLYLAGARTGTQVWKISDDPMTPAFHNAIDVLDIRNPADGLGLTNNHLYIGEGWSGVRIINIQNPSSYVDKSLIDLNGDSDSIEITSDENYMIVGNGGTGVSVVNIQDKANPRESGVWQNRKPGGSVENVLLNASQNLVFASLRYYGLVILDITNKEQDPIEISEYYSGMCEFVTLSHDEKHIFLSDGTKGITILNIEIPQNPPIFESKVNLKGFPTKMRLFPYDDYQFLFVGTRDKELLQVLNVTDTKNPTLFAKFAPELEQAYDLELTSDKKYLYLLTSKGLRVLPLTAQLSVHTEFVKLDEEGRQTSEQVINSQVQVGETEKLFFIPIGVGKQIKFDQITYYQSFKIIPKPHWMTFDPSQSSLTLKVSKEALEEGQQFNNNIIFVKLLTKLEEEDFIDPSIPITQSDAEQIIIDCKANGYISDSNFVTNQFKPNQNLFNFNTGIYLNPLIIDKITTVLQTSISQIPVRFTVINSLKFNPNSSNSDVISTLSSSLIINLKIKNYQEAVFINKQYKGSLSLLKDNQDDLTLEGPSQVVIQNLSNDIRIKSFVQDLNSIKFDLKIDDNLNYQLLQTDISLPNLKFIRLHEGVKINEKNKIQTQFNQVYAEGKIEIEEEFSFQFSENSFLSPANLELSYQFSLFNEDQQIYEPFPQDYWLVPNPTDRRISGKPSQFSLYTSIQVNVSASDGYSTAHDILEIKIWNFTVFQLVIQVTEYAAPLLTLLGLWRYRYTLYQYFFKRKFTYSDEEAIVGKQFNYVIPVMYDTLKKGQYLFSLLDFKFSENVFWNKNGDINQQKLIEQIHSESLNFKAQIQQKKINLTYLNDPKTRLYKTVTGISALYVMKNYQKDSFSLFQKMKEIASTAYTPKDWYKHYCKLTYNSENNSGQQFGFPEIDIQEHKINTIMDQFIQEQNREQRKKNSQPKNDGKILAIRDVQLQRNKFNLYLIKESLKAVVNGVQLQKVQYPVITRGIALHCQEYELFSIKGYLKVGNSTCFHDGYEACGLQSNQPLPQWMTVEIKNGFAVLTGTPSQLDVGQVNIRIYHDRGAILRKFNINVHHRKEEEEEVLLIQDVDQSNFNTQEKLLVNDKNLNFSAASKEDSYNAVITSPYEITTNGNSQKNIKSPKISNNQLEVSDVKKKSRRKMSRYSMAVKNNQNNE